MKKLLFVATLCVFGTMFTGCGNTTDSASVDTLKVDTIDTVVVDTAVVDTIAE